MSKAMKWWLAITTAALVLTGVVWWSVGYYGDTWNVFTRAVWHKFIVRDFTPSINPLGWTPLAYFFMMIGAAAAVPLFMWKYARVEVQVPSYSYKGEGSDTKIEWRWIRHTNPRMRRGALAVTLVAILCFCYTITGLWNDDKDEANSYLGSTQFVVENPSQLPESLKPLTEGAALNEGNACIFTTTHDVTSCVTKGSLLANWDSRAASLTGASIVMSRTSGAVPNTDIMDETLTYLHNKDGSGSWTAVRNGHNRQPIDGIVYWDGQNEPGGCKFEGDHDLKYAFDGNWGQNLDDTLARDFPDLLFDYTDMWGHCQTKVGSVGIQPAIVIPVVRQQAVNRRTTLRAAGVLTIEGSSSGEPVITHLASVGAGSMPGPVYPLSLVAKQREMLQWSAGRAHKNRLKFGYEASDVGSQSGNNGEYLLRDKSSGRLFWVTPLKPRSTSSQQLVAYSLTPADESREGSLNTQRVYVLPNNKPLVNIDDMEARVSEAIRVSNPGFFTGEKPGRIAEFLPVNETTWQVFAELNGRVVYRIEVPSDAKIKPTIQSLESSTPTEQPSSQPSTGLASCSNPKELSEPELVQCINTKHDELSPLLEELSSRHPK